MSSGNLIEFLLRPLISQTVLSDIYRSVRSKSIVPEIMRARYSLARRPGNAPTTLYQWFVDTSEKVSELWSLHLVHICSHPLSHNFVIKGYHSAISINPPVGTGILYGANKLVTQELMVALSPTCSPPVLNFRGSACGRLGSLSRGWTRSEWRITFSVELKRRQSTH